MPTSVNRARLQRQSKRKPDNKTSSDKAVLSCRKAALSYARRGLKVLALHGIKDGSCTCGNTNCRSPGKHPITQNGLLDATTDPITIKAWFKQYPDANVGIATGSASNVMVVDVDPRNGGLDSWKQLKEELGKSPKTVKVRTGGDGIHVLFSAEGMSVQTKHGNIFGSGIDLQADGAYIVAPPSRHSSGKRYRFMKDLSFEDVTVQLMPEPWKTRLQVKPVPVSPAITGPNTSSQIPEGQRNQRLTSLAGQLHNAGIPLEALLAALWETNLTQCSPPLEREEVETIAHSVGRYPVNSNEQDPAEIIAQIILDRHFAGGDHLLFATDGRFWRYDSRKWSPLQFSYLDNLIYEAMKTAPQPFRGTKSSLLKQVPPLLRARVSVNDDRLGFIKSSPIINCLNGELWIADDGSVTLRPHNATSYLTHCLDVTYDPGAKSPLYDRAIAEIFSKASNPQAMIEFWHEITGYIMQPRRDIPLILICEGRGSDGKTSLAGTIQQLIGPSLVSAMPVQDIEKNRFAIGSLVGKLLLLDDDMKAGIKLPDGILKKVSEDKTLTGEHKYGPPFNFTCKVVPMLLCNNPPSLSDLSYGMERRSILTPFGRSFQEHEIDRKLFPTIWATEMSGVLNLALAGLKRVRERGHFAQPVDVRKATARWRNAANSVSAFVDQCCDETGETAVQMLYKAYVTWCRDSGITSPQQQLNFRRSLEHLGYKAGRNAKARLIRGLSLKRHMID
jgi:putative DNA primase/helicase